MDKLINFQEFLHNPHHIQENQIPYYANWTYQFLTFSNQCIGLTLELRIQSFIEQLEIKYNKTDWQIRQADRAIKLYLYHFCDQQTILVLGGKPLKNSHDVDENNIIKKIKEAIRIKHYSRATERTYIHWIKIFFQY